MPETHRKRPKTQKTNRNSRTQPRPKGFLYQRPHPGPGGHPGAPNQVKNCRFSIFVTPPLLALLAV